MKTPRNLILFTLFLLGILLSVMDPVKIPQPLPTITPDREHHILYGDRTGGGHLHGIGKPCKTEFPQSWDAEKIIARVRAEAANDNVKWRREKNGYHSSDRMIDGVRVRIVLDEDRSHVITAYPVNLPRNTCPDSP